MVCSPLILPESWLTARVNGFLLSGK